DEPQPARLPEADLRRPAEHRDDHRGSAVPGGSVRRPGVRGAADRAGARRPRERDLRRDRRAAHRGAAHARTHRAGDRGYEGTGAAGVAAGASIRPGRNAPQSVVNAPTPPSPVSSVEKPAAFPVGPSRYTASELPPKDTASRIPAT